MLSYESVLRLFWRPNSVPVQGYATFCFSFPPLIFFWNKTVFELRLQHTHYPWVYPVLNLDFQDIANMNVVLTWDGTKGLRGFQIRFCREVMISFGLCNIALTLYYIQYWRVSTSHDLWSLIVVNYFEKHLAPFPDRVFHVSLAWLILDHLLSVPPRPMLTDAYWRSLM